ncbi:MAG: carbohydrate ABC transporter permease [Candidatus Dormibacteraeota bacterium]|nr:carbohydrate ABC transporter permease [Candidatus Dormibacteraeota bacterium]
MIAARERGVTAAKPRRRTVRGIVIYGLAAAYTLIVLLPVVYMVLVSLQSTVVAGTQFIPTVWYWQTYSQIWQTISLAAYIRNSLIICIAAGICSSLLALGTGYVVARFRFRFRNVFRVGLLATETVPGILLLLPLYVMFVIIDHAIRLQLVGTYYGVVITYMTFGLPFAVWLMNVYIVGLPVDLEEQAMVDGARRLGILRWVTFPLALPGLVVTFIFTFLLAWNDVLFASVLTSPTTRTLGVGLQYYLSENYSIPEWNQLMAASVISAVPAVVLFLFVQRYIVTGLAAGSVKG